MPKLKVFDPGKQIGYHSPIKQVPLMTTGYSNLTDADVVREIKAIKKAGKKISQSPKSARAFLIKAGILNKKGDLARQYR